MRGHWTSYGTETLGPSALSSAEGMIAAGGQRAAVAASGRLDAPAILHQLSSEAVSRRAGRTKSAASSASLRRALRGAPICARMVRPRAMSMTWLARGGCGKVRRYLPRADAVAKAAIYLRHYRSGDVLHELSDFCIVHERRDAPEQAPRRRPLLGRIFYSVFQKAGRETHEESAERRVLFAARAPYFSAYALSARRNIVLLSPKIE